MNETRFQDVHRFDGAFAGTFTPAGPGLLSRLVDRVLSWQRRANQRRHLMQLDDRLLADIGISRAEAWREYRTPFWR